jgi:hypothetical protein
VTVLLEPAVEVEHPVDRLHAVVGEEQDGRLLPEALRRGVDQLAAEFVNPFVDPQQLVPRLPRIVRRMLRVDARVAEVADVVRAHEVDAQETELRLQLVDELAHTGDLLGVLE